ncbi:MAG TPA: efflux RND transporter permease subunit, partial [Planctomycetota bacterium]|nr:efflux RND transporter permease subunit [Planctomycetota bacterium]
MALLIVILGVVSIVNMATDVFPSINIPVISVVYNYAGMSAEDMETRIVTQFERFVVTTVNDIEHIESQALNGIGVVKIFFQKNAKIEEAMAEVVATAQTGLRQMPPGAQPPLIIRFNASSVPILQLSISSDSLPEQQLFDITINQLRNQLITIPGVMIPYPYGGRQRQLMVDLDPEKLRAWGISAQDVANAISAQNLILPAGTAKIGTQEYPVRLNSSPDLADAINELPIKTVRGTTIYVSDVAQARDGYQVQTNVVHAGGKRGVLLSILKQGNASTLDVVDAVKRILPEAKKQLPPDLNIELLIDQSVFVRASVEGVVKEAILAAGLTGLMILLFLGSWRSTLIVVISIPLSILVSVIVLSLLGETLNVMTLGGLALAVGILVDDATVAIENIHRNIHQKKSLVQAILDGARQIALPSLVATLCICIVFVPVAFLGGAAGFLFTPLALAVVFAMLTSYFLSRTLLPTMAHYLLPHETAALGGPVGHQRSGSAAEAAAVTTPRARTLLARRGVRTCLMLLSATLVVAVTLGVTVSAAGRALATAALGDPWLLGAWLVVVVSVAALLRVAARHRLFSRLHAGFQRGFAAAQRTYGSLLAWTLAHRLATALAFAVLALGSCAALLPILGTDFFPAVDAGQIRLHVRAPPGTRIEQTEVWFARVADAVRARIPSSDLDAMLDNIGIPNSGINLSLSDGTLMSPADGEIMISLREGHRPTEEYVSTLRAELPQEFPELTFFFQPPDIVTQVLNFGLSSPIDVQIAGPLRNQAENVELAHRILADLRDRPGIADLHLQQVAAVPDLRVTVDRTLAGQMGLTQRDVAQNVLVTLSGTLQAAPNFWLNPQSGVTYSVIVQAPQRRIDSLASLEALPIQAPADASGAVAPQLLANLAGAARGASAANVTHYTIQRTVDVLMNVSGVDLGRAGEQVRAIVERYRELLPRGSTIALRGQVESMRTSFAGLVGGLLFSILLVYLLLAINFQSWVDPLIILMALPGAAAGIVWMLFVTGTAISVPALMGAIMAVGVATANSILLVTFANDQRRELGANAHDAALAAGITRLRPVVMTALAMIIGMLPMSLGLGEGGEQNAPLGRAVIGGLLLATLTTLGFVPVCYAVL